MSKGNPTRAVRVSDQEWNVITFRLGLSDTADNPEVFEKKFRRIENYYEIQKSFFPLEMEYEDLRKRYEERIMKMGEMIKTLRKKLEEQNSKRMKSEQKLPPSKE